MSNTVRSTGKDFITISLDHQMFPTIRLCRGRFAPTRGTDVEIVWPIDMKTRGMARRKNNI